MLTPPVSALLADLQHALQQHYDLELPHRVEDFVCDDAESLSQLTGCTLDGPETLLVQQQGDNLDITLFLDREIIAEVSEKPWTTHWHSKHFNSYCTILEGVSHFVCLCWNALHNRAVRPVELELQAEIDKFVVSTLSASARLKNHDRQQLLQRLFQNVEYRDDLTGEQYRRYERANSSAHSYCDWLCKNYYLAPDNHGLSAELARFYRTGGTDKFSRIASCSE